MTTVREVMATGQGLLDLMLSLDPKVKIDNPDPAAPTSTGNHRTARHSSRIPEELMSSSVRSLATELRRMPKVPRLERTDMHSHTARDKEDSFWPMVLTGLDICLKVACNHADNPDDLLDNFQEGFLGLVRAAEEYDPSEGTSYTTYAYRWVWQRITRYQNDNRLIRLPTHTVESLAKYRRRLLPEWIATGRAPSISSLLADRTVPGSVVGGLLAVLPYVDCDDGWDPLAGEDPVISWLLEEDGGQRPTVCNDGDCDALPEYDEASEQSPPGALVTSETPLDMVIRKETRETVATALGLLRPRERAIVQSYFGLDDRAPETLEDIGKSWGLTRERIRQIIKKALKQLRHSRYLPYLK